MIRLAGRPSQRRLPDPSPDEYAIHAELHEPAALVQALVLLAANAAGKRYFRARKRGPGAAKRSRAPRSCPARLVHRTSQPRDQA